MSPQELGHHESLRNLLRERGYKNATWRAMLVKPEGMNDWQLHLATVEFNLVEEDKAEALAYDMLRMSRLSTTAKEAAQTLDTLVTDGKIGLGNEEFELDGYLMGESPFSHGILPSYSYWTGQWPMRLFRFQAHEQKYNCPYGPFLKPDSAAFSNFGDAASHWLGIGRDDSRLSQPTVWIRLPDYRGRIENLTLTERQARVTVASLPGLEARLIGKMIIGGTSGRSRLDVNFDAGVASVELPSPWKSFELFLLDRRTGELVDYRQTSLDYGGPNDDPTVRFEASPANVVAWLQAGESEWIEFKPPGFRDDDLLETVVAFANGEGGRILVGVDDNSRPIGLSDEKARQRIESIVQARLDPVPHIDLESVELQSTPILVVNVPPGKDPPYVLRERGVFIRSGSTDRIPSRIELERLFRGTGEDVRYGSRWY